jgi:hypothetical protein
MQRITGALAMAAMAGKLVPHSTALREQPYA